MSRFGSPTGTIVVIGGGAAGALAAVHLLRATASAVDVVVVDPRGELGAGVAYSTRDGRHLLNSPAAEMSVFSDDPGHFVAWAQAREACVSTQEYLPRRLYGAYLRDAVAQARRSAGALGDLEWVAEEAVALCRSRRAGTAPFLVGLARGGHLEAAEVVLALGAPHPGIPWGNDALVTDDPRFVGDPWSEGALERLEDASRILLLGTGLTMVDVALSLAQGRADRVIHARSRHGLVARRHSAEPLRRFEARVEPASTARELVRAVRVMVQKAEFSGDDWRSVVGQVRRQVPELWAALPLDERQRIIRHALRYWEVHRHRMAPTVASELDRLVADGRLKIDRGRLIDIDPSGAALRVRLAGPLVTQELLEVDAVVNCTGPSNDAVSRSALVAGLLRDGLAQPDELGMGLKTDGDGCVISADGNSEPRLHVLGWARRGGLLETTAIPEIRAQAEALARRINAKAS